MTLSMAMIDTGTQEWIIFKALDVVVTEQGHVTALDLPLAMVTLLTTMSSNVSCTPINV